LAVVGEDIEFQGVTGGGRAAVFWEAEDSSVEGASGIEIVNREGDVEGG
jgi:hypothetical protein